MQAVNVCSFGGWATSRRVEVPGFASPPHDGFAFVGERTWWRAEECIGRTRLGFESGAASNIRPGRLGNANAEA